MPKTITKKAFAKLDLGIHIEPQKSKEGLFPVLYLVCQLDICDELSFEKTRFGIEIVCDYPGVPIDENNFIYKTAVLLKELSGKPNLGAKITLKKKIPVKAGFGGGSSDGAAAIGLSELWNIDVPQAKLLGFSRKLGKDFYFSLYGGLSEINSVGRNYKRTRIDSDLSFWVVVVVPFDEKPSTGWIYEHLDIKKIGKNLDMFKNLKKALLKGDKRGVLSNLCNDFESSVSEYFPIISQIKTDLAEVGASGKLMAGAGLSVVGFFENRAKAQKAARQIIKSGKYRQVLVSKTILNHV